MKYKPTLGGLKKAQKFLARKGHPMPIFQINIYDDKRLVGGMASVRWEPGKGKVVLIDELIQLYGKMYQVINVRLSTDQGDAFIEFSDRTLATSALELIDHAMDIWKDQVSIEFPADNGALKEFINSEDGFVFTDLARWGKIKPSTLDRIKFYFFPKHYANEVFT